ncbi:hypothetical protein KEHDKFFH_02505 [Marinobacter maroccanus]|uniref:Uncharacterized protein n=1 Tax=Marinobacter maroccanus TaxID=2055143 RepID=A0A2S5ZFX2_9GAMM|nr:hypothetical protein [Marinobacter maroccanus]PPI86211.1 hypothetical protein KEHDKFFH_02505 [Marinobacter maroccanus]
MGNIAPTYNYASAQIKRNLSPGSVVVTWNTGGQQYTLTDDGAGNLTGAGTGTVSYSTGLIFINPNPAPAPSDGDYTIDYEDWQGTTKTSDSFSLNVSAGADTSYNPGAAMREGSISIELNVQRIAKKWVYLAASGKADRIEYASEAVTVTDDGSGNLRREKDGPILGTVNYATGAITLNARQSYTYKVYNEKARLGSGNYWDNSTATATETYGGGSASIQWTDPADPVQVRSTTRPIPGLTIDLTPTSSRNIIPNSVLFEIAGTQYRDQDGAIIKNWSPITDTGTAVGSIDYSTGLVTLEDYPANTPTSTPVTLLACLTSLDQAPANRSIFRTAGAPLREGSLIVNATDIEGSQITLNADTAGNLTGGNIVSGFVDTQTGLVTIEWANDQQANSVPVVPSTVRYSAVSYTFLPLDAELVGLDATRLPSDGRVPQFNLGDVVVVSNTQQQEVTTATAGQVVNFARQNQAEVYVEGANGNRLDPAQYTLDTEAGTLTFADPLSLVDTEANAVTEPLQVFERVEDMGLATDVQIGGQIGLNIPLSQDYTAGDTIVSAAVLYGDLRARAYNAFHQKAFDGSTWSDELIGDSTTAKYNLVSNPIEVTNQGAIKERWAIRFTSSTSFEVIGETVGVVATGNISADLAPTNAATGAPYFTIRADGWGTGWVSGNTLRFNTDGGQAPFWVARTIVAGRAVEETDQFATQNRGDAD